jgi:hypothetical protein
MATPNPTRLPLTTRLSLLAWVIVLAAVVIAAVVGVGKFDDTWAVVVAAVAALAATLTLGLVVRDELAEADAPSPARVLGVRPAAAALGVAAGAALAIAAFGGSANAGDTSTSPATAKTAVRTVRDFVVAGAVDQNGEAACGFLTTAEQDKVGASAGGDCRQVFDSGSAPMPDGATTEAAVRKAPATVSIRDGRATVRLGTGSGAVTFVLDRATAAEQEEFNSPASAWRIAEGATAPPAAAA